MADEQSNSATSNNPEQDLRELLPAYSLGLTDPDETQQVEALLAAYPELAADLASEQAEYAEIRTALLHSVPPVTPPPALRNRLLAGLSAEAAVIITPAPVTTHTDAPQVVVRVRRWRRILAVMAAVMALLAALNTALLLRLSDLQMETDQLRAQVDDQASFISRYNQRDYLEFTVADTRAAAPDDTAQYEGTHGLLRCNPDSHVAVLEMQNLPPISAENAYQVWLIKDDQRISGGLIRPENGGVDTLIIYAPEPLGTYSYIGITREPATGSDAPTSDPVARGTLYGS